MTSVKHALKSPSSSSSARRNGYGSIPATTDDQIRKKPKSLSRSRAPWWSRLFFTYANPVMELGNERQLNQDDLWELEGENTTSVVYEKFRTQYLKKKKAVVAALFTTYGWDFFICGIGSMVMAGCDVFAPIVLNRVIDIFSAPTIDMDGLVLWLGAFFASRLTNAVVYAHTWFHMEIVLIRLTVSLKCLIFEKAMRRSVQSKHEADMVDITNLFTADMDNLEWVSTSLNSLWVVPIQLVVVVYLLYMVLGLAAFAGAGVMALSLVVTYFVSKNYATAYETLMDLKDNRMKVVKEVFGAIQIVKLNAWEDKFMERIGSWRLKELGVIARYMYTIAFGVFLFWSTPICVSVASFATYTLLMKQTLTAAKVFTAMMLFNSVAESIADFPEAIQSLVQARISLGRIREFLDADEIDPKRVSRDASKYPSDVVTSLENATLSWSTNDTNKAGSPGEATAANESTPTLSNVNLQVKKGDFVVVHGAVGAGKSSLCSALLGEMPLTSGHIFMRSDQVAYYSQQTWIQNLTVRDNILFGLPFDPEKYDRVVDACGLRPDFKQFLAGDMTEIGQRGINLSGGQKARVSLARACYADADMYILDSPLAAVDAVVQSEIFRKCLCGILETKTLVLVTHNPDIICSEAVDVRVLVENGKVTCERVERQRPRYQYGDLLKSGTVADVKVDDTEGADNSADNGVLVEDEERQAGRVSREVFKAYFNAIGGFKSALAFFTVLILWQSFQVSSDVWLSHWTGNKEGTSSPVEYNLRVYALLGLGTGLLVLVRSTLSAYLGLRGAAYLFDALTKSLLHAPLRFFDANPMGRIINRYSEDMSVVDVQLQYGVFGFFINLAINGFRIATAMFVMKYVSILVIPLAWIYVNVGHFYLAPSREVTRLGKVSNSPVLSHVSASEEGVAVLRSFGNPFVNRAVEENFKLIDANNRVMFAEALITRWLAIRINLIGCGFVVVVVSSLVWMKDILSPGLVGLAFMYAVGVDQELSFLVRAWSELELAMVSPERILEYASIEPEGHNKIVTFEPSETNWPQHGSITFENVVFSYKPGGAPVLKGVSFEIRENEKIGIVGRTGAGKSSLTMALFRINELVAGRILIDGVDISRMNLQTLRSRLSIIPQAPVLFKGSMRAYMDPFGDYDDAAIWTAFEKVGMKDMISSLDNKLDHELSENGENFSVGERQMLCLARALLRRSRVVVMDEATASIDHGTEKKLQEMIAHEFANATVVTIAHRLATVLESDRVLVLENGSVVEFDAPRSLVRNGGVFHELAKEGGYLKQLLD
ncbi:Atp-binding protein, partial [Globisporangium splendens]